MSSGHSIRGNESGIGNIISEDVLTLANPNDDLQNSKFSVIGQVKIQFSYNFSKSDFIVQILESKKNVLINNIILKHQFHFINVLPFPFNFWNIIFAYFYVLIHNLIMY